MAEGSTCRFLRRKGDEPTKSKDGESYHHVSQALHFLSSKLNLSFQSQMTGSRCRASWHCSADFISMNTCIRRVLLCVFSLEVSVYVLCDFTTLFRLQRVYCIN